MVMRRYHGVYTGDMSSKIQRIVLYAWYVLRSQATMHRQNNDIGALPMPDLSDQGRCNRIYRNEINTFVLVRRYPGLDIRIGKADDSHTQTVAFQHSITVKISFSDTFTALAAR